MTDDLQSLADRAKKPEDALCYLAELVSTVPADRYARTKLALAIGDAGHPVGAFKVLRTLAERMVHDGYLLPAIAVIIHGLQRSADDPTLIATLERLHVRGARAKAGTLAVPPPLRKAAQASKATTASALLAMTKEERLARATDMGCELPPPGPAVVPLPMPLFCELESAAFISTVKRLRSHRVPAGTVILKEGGSGDSLLVLVSGRVTVAKGGTVVGELGPGTVLGEMALITQAPRSATVTALEPVEYFELLRADVAALSKSEPKVVQELAAYCRSRLLLNLLRTSPLFSHFDEQTRIRLLGRFSTTTLEAGERAVAQGQPGIGLFVIASGKVQVQRSNPSGETVLLAELGPGEIFGEISLLKQQAATADVIAQQTVGAIVLPAQDFLQVLQEYPNVRPYLESLSAERLQKSYSTLTKSGLFDPDDLVVL
jgi:CRP-like cAMP-binding protein